MRVVFVNRQNWPSQTPGSAASTYNTHALAEQGIQVDLFVGQGTPTTLEKGMAYYDLTPQQDLHIHKIPKFHIGPVSSSKPFYWQAYRRILRLSSHTSIDAVHTRDPGFLPYLYKLKKYKNLKVYYESHNYFLQPELHNDGFYNMSYFQKYHQYEKKYLHTLDGIICILGPQAELYRLYVNPSKVHVVHPGLARPLPKSSPDPASPIIAYIGAIQPQRDFKVLFEAIKQLNLPKVKLLLIGGRAQELPIIEQKVSESGISHQTHITGWVSKPEMNDYLDTATVGVVPMKDNFFNRSLTAPMKIFDYLAKGVPVISTDLPSSSEFLDQEVNALFYPAGDVESLSEALRRILIDPTYQQKLAEGAWKKAHELTWNKRAQKLIDLFSA